MESLKFIFQTTRKLRHSRVNDKIILVTTKEKHKNLKKKVNIAEGRRNLRRGPNSWYDLRTLKKLKLSMKDKLLKGKS